MPLLPVISQREHQRRLDLWRTYLGSETELGSIEPLVFRRFIKERREGRIVVAKRKLAKVPSLRTVGADPEVLRTIANHAMGARIGSLPLLTRNPVTGIDIPTTPAPKGPVATYESYRALRAAAPTVRLAFGPFLDRVEGLGWRVSAVCQLRASDFEFTKGAATPFGRIRKRGENDKEGIAMWVPMSGQVAEAGKRAIAIANAEGVGYLFTTSRRPNQPWSRFYARDLLEKTEKRAKLEPLEGGDFHPYRRAWATARKHLPVADVAAAGGWKSPMTVLRHYQQVDDETLFRVVSDPHKLQAAAKKRSSRVAKNS
ncbi:MAG: tyrosine-type recombinase/integrase [Gemmatimonadales bacterium]|nr:tyrosine-type recombinase/integrase [Gemmatimonadales bacterium]